MRTKVLIAGIFSCVWLSAALQQPGSRSRAVNRRLLEALEAGQLDHLDLVAVEDIEYGISEDNTAWFWYKDELGHEFFYDDLSPNENLYVTDHEDKSDVYSLIDEDHMISMLIHGTDDVSISVWTIQNPATGGKQALPSFHLTSHSQIKNDDFHRARKLSDTKVALLYVAYEYDASFETGGCASVVIQDVINETGSLERVTFPLDDFDFNTHSPKKESRRILHDQIHGSLETRNGVERRRLPATRFENCYPDEDSTARFLDVSFLADLGYFTSFNSDVDAVRKSVEVIVTNANLVYAFQFNVRIRLQQLYIVTKNIGFLSCGSKTIQNLVSQDPSADTCCLDIFEAEETFERFSRSGSTSRPSGANAVVQVTRSSQVLSGMSKAAHWHLLSNCFPPNCGKDFCTVGISVMNGNPVASRALACEFSTGRNVGVSSRSFQTWITFAHELGHNFGGASHSFEHGRGRTGGIMDYANGKIGATYEFNKLRKNEFCTSISEFVEGTKCRINNLNYFTDLNDPCKDLPDFTRFSGQGNSDRDCGICLNSTCTPVELLLKVNDDSTNQTAIEATDADRFPYEFLVEPAEFSPLKTDEDSIITAELFVSNPLDACSELDGAFEGTIVIALRGGCVFTDKVQNALNAGAVAIIIFNDKAGAPKPIGGEGYIDMGVVGISKNDGETILDLISVSNSGRVTAAIGGFPAITKELDFKRETFFDKYKILILTFVGVAFPGSILWIVVRYRDRLAIRAAKLKENIVDAAVENGHRVAFAYERVSMSIRNPQMLNFLRASAIPAGAEEIGKRARENDAGSANEGGEFVENSGGKDQDSINFGI